MTSLCAAERAQTGRGRKRSDKESVYSEIRIVEYLELVELAPFYKGQNICRTKRLIFLTELRSKRRKSERSEGLCANALISFYDPVKLGLYSHIFKYFWISALEKKVLSQYYCFNDCLVLARTKMHTLLIYFFLLFF